MAAPSHPALDDHALSSNDPAAAVIAFINNTTPQKAQAYLAGKSQDPNPDNPGKCPRWCARLQNTTALAFPLTFDGSHHSCRFGEFLATHQNDHPITREAHTANSLEEMKLETAKARNAAYRQQWAQPTTPENSPQ